MLGGGYMRWKGGICVERGVYASEGECMQVKVGVCVGKSMNASQNEEKMA